MKSKIIEKDGKKFVRVGDLNLDPENNETYNNPKKEKENQLALRTSFRGRKARKLHILEQPIMVREATMTSIVGNSRTQAATDEYGPDELVWFEWHTDSKNVTRFQKIRDRADSNIFREHGWNEKYNILKEFLDAYLDTMGTDMELKDFKTYCKKFKTTLESYKKCDEIVNAQGDTQDLIDLDNEDSKYGTSLEQVHTEILQLQKGGPDLPNPNAIDFDKLFDNKPSIPKKALDDLKEKLRIMRSLTLHSKKRKQPVNMIFDSKLGWEKGQFTGVVSNIAQSCFAVALEEFHNVQTPINREGDADIIFVDLNVKKCEKVKIELKSSSIEDGKIKANMRAGQMNRNWHIFVLHQDKCTRLAVMMVPIDGDVWSGVSGSKRKETTYQTIIEKHEKDIKFLMGDFYFDNKGDIQIEYEKF